MNIYLRKANKQEKRMCALNYIKFVSVGESYNDVTTWSSTHDANVLQNMLKIPSMRERWLRSDLIETFKVLNGYSRQDSNIFFQLNPSRRGHAFMLKKPRCNSKARQTFF